MNFLRKVSFKKYSISAPLKQLNSISFDTFRLKYDHINPYYESGIQKIITVKFFYPFESISPISCQKKIYFFHIYFHFFDILHPNTLILNSNDFFSKVFNDIDGPWLRYCGPSMVTLRKSQPSINCYEILVRAETFKVQFFNFQRTDSLLFYKANQVLIVSIAIISKELQLRFSPYISIMFWKIYFLQITGKSTKL